MTEQKYTIELFSHCFSGNCKSYAWLTHPEFLKDIEKLEKGKSITAGVLFHFNRLYESEALDLFKIKALLYRLRNVGVKCELVKF